MRVAAALLCAGLAGCADEQATAPASIEPTAQELPLPPVKPAHMQTSGLPLGGLPLGGLPTGLTESIPSPPML